MGFYETMSHVLFGLATILAVVSIFACAYVLSNYSGIDGQAVMATWVLISGLYIGAGVSKYLSGK